MVQAVGSITFGYRMYRTCFILSSPGDVEGQTRAALATIGEALGELGASFGDVVRTRVFLTDVSRWEEAARAHGEVFRDVRPANTTAGGLEFIDPAILVEVEVTAVVEPG